MNSKRDFLMDAFLSLIWLAVFYGFFIMPAVILFGLRLDVLLIVSVMIQLYLYFVRRFVRLILPMVLLHLIIPVAAFYIAPGIVEQVQYIAVSVVLVLFSLQQRYTRSVSFALGFTVAAPLVLVVIALALGYLGHSNVYTIYAVLVIYTGLCSKLHMRMTYVNDSLTVITQTSTQPVKKIMAFDYKATIALTVVIIGMIAFLHIFLLRPALEAVYDIVTSIRFELPYMPYEDVQLPMPPPSGGGMNISDIMGFYEVAEPWLIWVILERILIIVLPPAVVFGLGVIIFRLARNIYRLMGVKSNQDHEHASGYEDIKEFIRTPKVKRSWFFGSRNEHKLRRLFRETVTRHMKKGVPIKKSDTPIEMAEKIQAESISKLADEYAAVRYGNL